MSRTLGAGGGGCWRVEEIPNCRDTLTAAIQVRESGEPVLHTSKDGHSRNKEQQTMPNILGSENVWSIVYRRHVVLPHRHAQTLIALDKVFSGANIGLVCLVRVCARVRVRVSMYLFVCLGVSRFLQFIVAKKKRPTPTHSSGHSSTCRNMS